MSAKGEATPEVAASTATPEEEAPPVEESPTISKGALEDATA